jgi:hypothetical protein
MLKDILIEVNMMMKIWREIKFTKCYEFINK